LYDPVPQQAGAQLVIVVDRHHAGYRRAVEVTRKLSGHATPPEWCCLR
jgi:hypothetical protein